MNRMQWLVVVAALALLGSSFALAMEPGASVEQGKALFNDSNLGSSGKSCATCHPDGKGMETAGENEHLDITVNACIRQALKGESLDRDSVEMQSLLLYLNSLAE